MTQLNLYQLAIIVAANVGLIRVSDTPPCSLEFCAKRRAVSTWVLWCKTAPAPPRVAKIDRFFTI